MKTQNLHVWISSHIMPLKIRLYTWCLRDSYKYTHTHSLSNKRMNHLGAKNFESNPSIMSRTSAFEGSNPLRGEHPVLLLAHNFFFVFLSVKNSWLLLRPGANVLLFMTTSNKFLSSGESWTLWLLSSMLNVFACKFNALWDGDRAGRALIPLSLYLTRLMRWWSQVTRSRM